MARIRSVHPGLFSDEAFVECSMPARLLQIGIWTEADDKGVFEWKPQTLKMRIFPADTLSKGDIESLLTELLEANTVQKFEADGKAYGAIRNFRRYQRPKKPNDIYPLPDRLREYVYLPASSSVPVGNQFGTGGEKSFQMEDGGWRRKDEGGNNNRHIQEEGLKGSTRNEFVDDDGVIHEEYDFEVAS